MKKIMMMMALMSAIGVQARYHVVSSQKVLGRLLDRYEYAVVCFAPASSGQEKNVDKEGKQEIRHEFRSLEHDVNKASQSNYFDTYLKQDVGFVVVNVASKNAQDVEKQYDLQRFPVCKLFKQGKIRSMSQLVRPRSRYDILSFIDKQVGPELHKIVKDRQADEKQHNQDWLDAQYASVNKYNPYGAWPTYDWSGPYWGGPYTYGPSWASGFPGVAWFVGF